MKYLNRMFSVPIHNERYDEIDWDEDVDHIMEDGGVIKRCPTHGLMRLPEEARTCPYCERELLKTRQDREE